MNTVYLRTKPKFIYVYFAQLIVNNYIPFMEMKEPN